MKSGVECHSADEYLGSFTSIHKCANACKAESECYYFVFGIGNKWGQCWWEKTDSRSCPEGWEQDQYLFYEMLGTLDYNMTVIQICYIRLF